MNKKKLARKLTLSRETIQHLDSDQLTKAHGGVVTVQQNCSAQGDCSLGCSAVCSEQGPSCDSCGIRTCWC